MGALTVRVARVLDEAVDVRSFELRGADGGALPPYTPGSHVDVHAAPGIVRQYSLCGDPRETDRYLIAVKREAASRGGSVAMHERVSEGASLVVGAPRNNFALVPGASHHLLIAGGIGITPILAMARHLLATGASFQLVYFSRSIAHTAFHALLSGPEFAEGVRAFRDRVAPRFSNAAVEPPGPGSNMGGTPG